jgi:hypothetical protein
MALSPVFSTAVGVSEDSILGDDRSEAGASEIGASETVVSEAAIWVCGCVVFALRLRPFPAPIRLSLAAFFVEATTWGSLGSSYWGNLEKNI